VGDKIKNMAASLLSSLGVDRGADASAAIELERKRIELAQTAQAAQQAMPELESRIIAIAVAAPIGVYGVYHTDLRERSD
jgi:hypothetical protein